MQWVGWEKGVGEAQRPFLRLNKPTSHGRVAWPKPTSVVNIRETLLNQSLTNAALVVRSFFLNWDFLRIFSVYR